MELPQLFVYLFPPIMDKFEMDKFPNRYGEMFPHKPFYVDSGLFHRLNFTFIFSKIRLRIKHNLLQINDSVIIWRLFKCSLISNKNLSNGFIYYD